MRSRTTYLAVSLVLLAVVIRIVATRLGWFPQNFSTIGAMMLFAGAVLRPRWLGISVAVVGLLASDLVLRHDPQWLSVYVPCLLIAVAAHLLKPGQSVTRFALATVSASLIFFVVSNFGVWVAWPDMYDRSIAGLANCYLQAIPFFRNTLAGDAFFGVVLFGSYALLENRSPAMAEA
jgi:hypothetical protein